MTSSQDDECVDGAGAGVTQDGKRVRKLSQRARALQEAAEAKVRSVSFSQSVSSSHPHCPLDSVRSIAAPIRFCSAIRQSPPAAV